MDEPGSPLVFSGAGTPVVVCAWPCNFVLQHTAHSTSRPPTPRLIVLHALTTTQPHQQIEFCHTLLYARLVLYHAGLSECGPVAGTTLLFVVTMASSHCLRSFLAAGPPTIGCQLRPVGPWGVTASQCDNSHGPSALSTSLHRATLCRRKHVVRCVERAGRTVCLASSLWSSCATGKAAPPRCLCCIATCSFCPSQHGSIRSAVMQC